MVHVARLSELDPAPERTWLINPYMPAGELTLLTGAQRTGKGLFATHVAAQLTRGQRVPWDLEVEQGDNVLSPHQVLWVVRGSGEDCAHEIMARMRAAEANLELVRFVQLAEDESWRDLGDLLGSGGPTLVVVDPLQAAVGDLGARTVRGELEGFVELARESETTILAIRHIVKSTSGRAATEVGRGRGDVGQVARSELLLGPHPNRAALIVMAQARSSYGVGEHLAFTLDYSRDTPRIQPYEGDWDDELSPEDLLPASPPRRRPSRPRRARERAITFLREALSGEGMLRSEVLRLARRRKLAERTIERAAEDLGVVRQADREGGRFASAWWSLPVEPEWQTVGTRQPPASEPLPPAPPFATSAEDRPPSPDPDGGKAEDEHPGAARFRSLILD